LLDFSTSFLTHDADEFYGALNIITQLSIDNRLELVAEKSDLSKTKDAKNSQTVGSSGNVTLEVTNKSSTGGSSDSLVIYFLPFHPHAVHSKDPQAKREQQQQQQLWNKLQDLYAGTQGASSKDADCTSGNGISKEKKIKGEATNRCFVVDPNRIELRTMPVTPETRVKYRLDSAAPIMKSYSALGILKNATEPREQKIAFVTADEYRRIRSYAWNNASTVRQVDDDAELTFYTLAVDDDPAAKLADPNVTQEVTNWLWSSNNPIIYKQSTAISDDFIKGNRVMGLLRRYILIVKSSNAPANAYVAHFDHGEWYYIDADDEISQKNFDLISLFMTMMAIPSATPPLSPTISVGG
jgi:hypothetical protein